ncbi:MAG: carbamoyltransferase HypF [Gammaproteobacteria bacterium]|nr:carbamoyltransferase HypF [Gammaproteobacteria bacterium]
MRPARPAERGSARRLVVAGRVQAVGFRPFAYRLAHAMGLCGWVRNGAGQVHIHLEGEIEQIARFERELIARAPPLARPRLVEAVDVASEDARHFLILPSENDADPQVHLPPDLYCCDDCAAEMRDPGARRHGYAFTNCTQCGPRYTIIESLPYDRSQTSMAAFEMCPLCAAEYADPLDRRFHAEPLACPACGPRLEYRRDSSALCGDRALAATVLALRAGDIVAVKGVGGYHLMCDPANAAAVRRLRARKHRPDKPLAVMFPERGSDRLESVRAAVELDPCEARTCADATRPIVLARRRADADLAEELAPGLAELGVFLPYSPLHHRLLDDFGGPLVATSGNPSGEPVITDATEAERRLGPVADAFLHHDRPILRPADDPVCRIVGGRARTLRNGRGTAPLELDCPWRFRRPLLAVGGHQKCAIALGWQDRAVLSPHIGDLDSLRGRELFERLIGDLQRLYRVEAAAIVCDAHRGYASSRWARGRGLPVVPVGHHVAHAAALAGEYTQVRRWLTFAWDGLGAGLDGELWGGEVFLGSPGRFRRVASLRPFHLPGGDRAAREPWRSAAALFWECGRDFSPRAAGATLARQARDRGLLTSRCSSVGRLFDAAAALVLGIESTSFEGQAAMRLESVAADTRDFVPLPISRDRNGLWRTDWEPLLDVLTDADRDPGWRAGVFHESLAQALCAQATALASRETFDAVGLAGGVFQNRRLAERVLALLAAQGVPALLPASVPVNDGGLAFGQLVEAAHLQADAAVAAAEEIM